MANVGLLTGRMFGKTAAIGKFINAEVLAGRATMIGLAAQNLLRSKGMQVPALIETAPPWNRPGGSTRRSYWCGQTGPKP